MPAKVQQHSQFTALKIPARASPKVNSMHPYPYMYTSYHYSISSSESVEGEETSGGWRSRQAPVRRSAARPGAGRVAAATVVYRTSDVTSVWQPLVVTAGPSWRWWPLSAPLDINTSHQLTGTYYNNNNKNNWFWLCVGRPPRAIVFPAFSISEFFPPSFSRGFSK